MANEYFASKSWLTKYAQADDSRGAWQDYVKEVEDRDSRSMVQEPRNMYNQGQLVSNTVDGSRPGYGGDEFINLNDIKKYNKNLLDKSIMISTAPGRTGANQTEPVKLRDIFEVVERTKDGDILVNDFKKNPTSENFLKLKTRRKNRLSFEKEQLLPSDERETKLAKEREYTKKWRESGKGQKYLNNLFAKDGIFPAYTSQERIWRDIYRASKQKKEDSRFKIKYPKNIEIDPETNLPKKITTKSGSSYIPWDKYYKDISFYDTQTGSTIKFGNMREWMKNNIKGGVKKYDNAIDNYNIKKNIEDFKVDGKSLASIAKDKKEGTYSKKLTTAAAVNHRSGLNNFWDTEITTATANQQLNNKIQSRISALKNAPNPMAKDRILKQMKAEINKIKGGATLVVDGQTIGKTPTLRKVSNALANELNVDLLKLAGTVTDRCKVGKADGGRIGFSTGSVDCVNLGKETLNEMVQKGSGTIEQRSILKRVISGSGRFIKDALNPKEFFKLKNLIGLPAAVAAVAYDTVMVTDDMLRKRQPFDLAAGNEFLAGMLNLQPKVEEAKRLLADPKSSLSSSAKEYAQSLVDLGEYNNILKLKQMPMKVAGMPGDPEDQEKLQKQLDMLDKKMSNTSTSGELDYINQITERDAQDQAGSYIGEPISSKGGPMYARDGDGNLIKVNEYGYGRTGLKDFLGDAPDKTKAPSFFSGELKKSYGNLKQEPGKLPEYDINMIPAYVSQNYKTMEENPLTKENIDYITNLERESGLLRPGENLDSFNLAVDRFQKNNQGVSTKQEVKGPTPLEHYQNRNKWFQALSQPGMLGAGDKFADGGLANLMKKYYD